jgi:hypothetical protein
MVGKSKMYKHNRATLIGCSFFVKSQVFHVISTIDKNLDKMAKGIKTGGRIIGR